MPQSKETDWLNGYKYKTHIYTVNKRPTSDLQTHFRPYRMKVGGWKKIFHANGNQKKARVAMLISDKTHFKINTITRDKEGHYIMIKGSIQEEDITIVNIYAPNIGAPQYISKITLNVKGLNAPTKIHRLTER